MIHMIQLKQYNFTDFQNIVTNSPLTVDDTGTSTPSYRLKMTSSSLDAAS
jgi:hypothetical protein